MTIKVDGVAEIQTVQVGEVTFPETDVVVEDELANPSKPDRERIDADNAAILRAVAKASGEPQFVRAFRRPPGEINSVFGEWRTFNDGHRSQHLGLDLFAREGSRVKAINAGTVVLVRPCFLAGNVVVVAHGGGIASAYFHLSKVSVAEGDRVAQGDELGLAGPHRAHHRTAPAPHHPRSGRPGRSRGVLQAHDPAERRDGHAPLIRRPRRVERTARYSASSARAAASNRSSEASRRSWIKLPLTLAGQPTRHATDHPIEDRHQVAAGRRREQREHQAGVGLGEHAVRDQQVEVNV